MVKGAQKKTGGDSGPGTPQKKSRSYKTGTGSPGVRHKNTKSFHSHVHFKQRPKKGAGKWYSMPLCQSQIKERGYGSVEELGREKGKHSLC